MPSQTFTARFCRFTGPAHWHVAEGLGLVDYRTTGPGVSAVVSEGWEDPPVTAAEYVARQREVAEGQGLAFEVVDERPLPGPRLPDAHLAVYRRTLDDGAVLLQKQLTAAAGPLVCTVTVSGAAAEERGWGGDADRILDSFEVVTGWLGAAGGAAPAPQPPGTGPAELSVLSWAGLEVGLPPGWTVADGERAVHGPGGAVLEVRRGGLPGGTAEECFAAALARVAADGELQLARWDRGRRDGRPFYELVASAERRRTWGPPQQRTFHHLYVEDEGILGFLLDGEGAGLDAVVPAVAAGYRWLPAEERRLTLGESWAPAELTGAWRSVGPGSYVCLEPSPLILALFRVPADVPLKDAAARQVEGLAAEVGRFAAREELHGPWKGRSAFRFTGRAESGEGPPLEVRLAMVDTGRMRAMVALRGSDGERCDAVLVAVLDALRPQGAEAAP